MRIFLQKHTEHALHRSVVAGVFELSEVCVGPSLFPMMRLTNVVGQCARVLMRKAKANSALPCVERKHHAAF